MFIEAQVLLTVCTDKVIGHEFSYPWNSDFHLIHENGYPWILMRPQYEMKFVVLIIYDIIIMISDDFCWYIKHLN